jgi:hypothetical protein
MAQEEWGPGRAQIHCQFATKADLLSICMGVISCCGLPLVFNPKAPQQSGVHQLPFPAVAAQAVRALYTRGVFSTYFYFVILSSRFYFQIITIFSFEVASCVALMLGSLAQRIGTVCRSRSACFVLDLPWWIHTRASRMMEGHLGRAPNIIFHDGRLPGSRSLLQAWNRAQKSAFFNSLPGRGLEEPNHCRFVVSPVSPLFPWTFMRACQVRHRERLPRGQMICFGVYAANDSVTI